MAIETIAVGIIENAFYDIAETVQMELKDEIQRNLKHPGNSSGQAANSIAIQKTSPVRIFVGSADQHLNFLIRGNGGGRIPHGGKKPKGPMPITYGSLGGPVAFRMSSTGYAGKPYILSNVANRHR